MNTILQLLLELISLAPSLVQDGETVYNQLHASPDAAAKAQAVATGIQHIVTTVQPVLGKVGQ